MQPTDVEVRDEVDAPRELFALPCNCVVFSRHVASSGITLMSGSDFDGDIAQLSSDPALVQFARASAA
eukprot:2036686-Amphidinium_carterae.2